jgi:hypothetical protein
MLVRGSLQLFKADSAAPQTATASIAHLQDDS